MLGEARIGTTGFAYRDWVGSVYPRGATAGQLLPIYAERLNAVEIASTNNRAPSPELLASWAAAVPPGFQFALKAPNRAGHELGAGKVVARALAPFLDALERLGDSLGPMLVQVPITVKADRHALSSFLSSLPEDLRVAFDFHHPSWRDDATLRLLSQHEAALVLTDHGEGAPRLDLTAGFTYVRIRRDDDRQEAMDEWAERLGLLARRGVDVYAFLKHDRKGLAVERALRLSALCRAEHSYANCDNIADPMVTLVHGSNASLSGRPKMSSQASGICMSPSTARPPSDAIASARASASAGVLGAGSGSVGTAFASSTKFGLL